MRHVFPQERSTDLRWGPGPSLTRCLLFLSRSHAMFIRSSETAVPGVASDRRVPESFHRLTYVVLSHNKFSNLGSDQDAL